MGERKGVNKYYPPDFDPSKGGLNKYHGTHALRERARKLHEGILIIRFEMPYNIWCNGCGNHIGMGVRYNAQKRKVGNYYTTPIYKFRMKCHLCDQHFEIRTDPKNCEYEILSGCRRKEERWDTEKAGNVQTTDREVKEKLMTNAMYKLEHQAVDAGKVKKLAPTLSRLEEIRDTWDDDFSVNQMLRKKFREEKKEMASETEKDDNLKRKMGLPLDLVLTKESEEDKEKAQGISYGNDDDKTNIVQSKKRVKEASIFGTSSNAKMDLAKSLANKRKTSHTFSSSKKMHSSLGDLGIKVGTKSLKVANTNEILPGIKDVEPSSVKLKNDNDNDSRITEDTPLASISVNPNPNDSSSVHIENERLAHHSCQTNTMKLDIIDKTDVEDTQTSNISECGSDKDLQSSSYSFNDSNLSCNSTSSTEKLISSQSQHKENSNIQEYNMNFNSNIKSNVSEEFAMSSDDHLNAVTTDESLRNIDPVSSTTTEDVCKRRTSLVDYYSSGSSDGDN